MSDILNASGKKVAKLGDDMKVRNTKGEVIGYIDSDNHVFQRDGDKAGRFDFKGHIYKAERIIGKVRPDGTVYDEENHLAGKVKGDNVMSAGAALMLLIV